MSLSGALSAGPPNNAADEVRAGKMARPSLLIWVLRRQT